MTGTAARCGLPDRLGPGWYAASFLIAIALTPWLFKLGLFGLDISEPQAMLFMGAAISITVFPVLARIIEERGLS